MNISKNYDPKLSEPKWQKYWESKEIFKFDPKSKSKIYSIDTPPPTVSGKMHIGHASMYSQMDFIARFKRMKGFNLFYPFGTDDNGLATERLIETEKNVKANSMERKEFVKICLSTLKDIRKKYIADWKAMGISCDWSIFYTTINEHCQKISQKSFIDLYKIGREYRKEAPTIWCPECHTAIAQVELEDKKLTSHFNDIIFKVGNEDLIIATTRPELLPSCVAVFYHPDDKRYQKYKNKKAKVPLFDYEVPILPDEKADPEKGTGIVMCCTFGDLTDIDWWYAHKLPLKISISEQGIMNEEAGKYKNLTIKQARKQIIYDLKEAGLLKKQEPITHDVNVHERCGTEIEFLVTKQWFIKYLDLKNKFLEAGNKLDWYPKFMKNRYDNWIKGLKWDWCISRQRYFGVPFPVWYCKECNEIILAEESQLPVDPLNDAPKKSCHKCNSKEFIPERDVLDTWATSSLTPQIVALLFPKHYDKLYPMNLRPQAHDIITFWLFNTIVKSQLHSNKNPWSEVVISGFALDPHGKKMSKSKGNIIEPQEMIKKYSADALRFWAASAKLGDDLSFQEKELITGTKLITKLWNASKFTTMHLKDYNFKKPSKLEVFDIYLLSKLNRLIDLCTKSFEEYEYSKVKRETEYFFWNIFCDNYLEIIKDRVYNPNKRGKKSKESAQYTLYITLFTLLKLFAPIMPHITEEIYYSYFLKYEKEKSIHITKWPKVDKKEISDKIENSGDEAIKIISEVRQFKTKNNKSLKEEVVLILPKNIKEKINPFLEDIKATTNAKEIMFGEKLKINFG